MRGPLALLGLRPLRSAGAILCFHGVADAAAAPPGSVHVSRDRLAELIDAARACGEIVPLLELLQRHRAGRSTAGLVAITADDAYASWGEAAAELAARGVPLTMFVVTEAAATGAPYWWDRVDEACMRVSAARWRAFEDACHLPASYRRGQPARFGPLRPLRQWVLADHAGRWPGALAGALDRLERDAGATTRQRSMTFDAIARVAAIPGVSLGVHTVSHPVLPLLSDDELHREVAASYAALRERWSAVVPVLAAPFGLFDQRTIRVARAAGISATLTLAAATLRGLNGRGDLPRFCVTRDDSAAKLPLRLTEALDWLRARPPRFPTLPSPTT